MRCCQGLANGNLPLLLGFFPGCPAPVGALAKLTVTADLIDAQALNVAHPRYPEPETRVEESAGFLHIHIYRRLGLK